MKGRTYLVGRYQYREMKRPQIVAVRDGDVDSLPPTMLSPIRRIHAQNMRNAVARFRQELNVGE